MLFSYYMFMLYMVPSYVLCLIMFRDVYICKYTCLLEVLFCDRNLFYFLL